MNKKKVLISGATGFIGKNIVPFLKEYYELFLPNRKELDLRDSIKVKEYIINNGIDVVLHCANPNASKNINDNVVDMCKDSLKIFINLQSCSALYQKMIYFGSGAEFDKRKDICMVRETECFDCIPVDDYGFAKYIMNTIADKSDNIYNLCLFGCYGPGDYYKKFITHCIRSVLLKKEITIRSDCWFDYIHVYDLVEIVKWMIDNEPQYHMYNVVSGKRILLSQIAQIINEQMKSEKGVRILVDVMNKEYTASNQRIIEETGIVPKISIEEGVRMQIEWEKANWTADTLFDGE